MDLGQANQRAGQVRLGEGGLGAEFLDISARTKHTVLAVEDDCFHPIVSGCALAGVDDSGAQRLAECIDRWMGQAY
ncbi:hypothetical protein D3C85_1306790 [compost metagenome]